MKAISWRSLSAACGLGLSLYLSLATPASALTWTVDVSERGWFSRLGVHEAGNENTLTGACCNVGKYRSFFSFELPQFSAPVRRATLHLSLEGYRSDDGFEDLTVRDVDPAHVPHLSDVFPPRGEGLDIYQDLGSGRIYGRARVPTPFEHVENVNGLFVDIVLSGNALADINRAAGERFAVGLSLDEISPPFKGEEWLRFSVGSEHRTHQLILASAVPEPATAGMLGLGVLALLWRRRAGPQV